MKKLIQRFVKDESGITALETAIILIAFVVVAAVFAFTVLSTGTFLTERSKEAAYSGLQEVRGSMELKGSMVLDKTLTGLTPAGAQVIEFNLATVAGGSSVDLSKVNIAYRDSSTNTDLTYDASDSPPAAGKWVAVDVTTGNPIQILGAGDMAKVIVQPANAIGANATFALEVKPPSGGVLLLERTAPAQIDTVTDLH